MAGRREWTEWHLTPRGWERGATRAGGKNVWKDDPEDRVLSWTYKEVESGAETEPTRSSEESWRSKLATDAEVESLLREHGPAPREL
jgi:hypothetical protein